MAELLPHSAVSSSLICPPHIQHSKDRRRRLHWLQTFRLSHSVNQSMTITFRCADVSPYVFFFSYSPVRILELLVELHREPYAFRIRGPYNNKKLRCDSGKLPKGASFGRNFCGSFRWSLHLSANSNTRYWTNGTPLKAYIHMSTNAVLRDRNLQKYVIVMSS